MGRTPQRPRANCTSCDTIRTAADDRRAQSRFTFYTVVGYQGDTSHITVIDRREPYIHAIPFRPNSWRGFDYFTGQGQDLFGSPLVGRESIWLRYLANGFVPWPAPTAAPNQLAAWGPVCRVLCHTTRARWDYRSGRGAAPPPYAAKSWVQPQHSTSQTHWLITPRAEAEVVDSEEVKASQRGGSRGDRRDPGYMRRQHPPFGTWVARRVNLRRLSLDRPKLQQMGRDRLGMRLSRTDRAGEGWS